MTDDELISLSRAERRQVRTTLAYTFSCMFFVHQMYIVYNRILCSQKKSDYYKFQTIINFGRRVGLRCDIPRSLPKSRHAFGMLCERDCLQIQSIVLCSPLSLSASIIIHKIAHVHLNGWLFDGRELSPRRSMILACVSVSTISIAIRLASIIHTELAVGGRLVSLHLHLHGDKGHNSMSPTRHSDQLTISWRSPINGFSTPMLLAAAQLRNAGSNDRQYSFQLRRSELDARVLKHVHEKLSIIQCSSYNCTGATFEACMVVYMVETLR